MGGGPCHNDHYGSDEELLTKDHSVTVSNPFKKQCLVPFSKSFCFVLVQPEKTLT